MLINIINYIFYFICRFYCVNTVEVTILGKLILLIKYVLAQFNENPKAIDANSTSNKIARLNIYFYIYNSIICHYIYIYTTM